MRDGLLVGSGVGSVDGLIEVGEEVGPQLGKIR
jgi:hypothetical protein